MIVRRRCRPDRTGSEHYRFAAISESQSEITLLEIARVRLAAISESQSEVTLLEIARVRLAAISESQSEVTLLEIAQTGLPAASTGSIWYDWPAAIMQAVPCGLVIRMVQLPVSSEA